MEKYPTGWFAVLDSKELKNKLLPAKLFGIELVFWRNKNSEPVAMLDQCPHRSAKISLGRKIGDCVECPFHGFQFSQDGKCEYAPEFSCPLPSLKIKTFFCRDFRGFIWIWTGNSDPSEKIPWLDELNHKFVFSQLKDFWESDITRCIENQLDYTHLPFVHRNTIGKAFKLDKKRIIKNNIDKIQIILHAEKEYESPSIEFIYPNIWINKINKNFILLLAFVPVEEGKTKLYLRSYQNYIKIPFLKHIFSYLINMVNFIILRQDKSVVLSQGKITSTEYINEVLMENDLAIRYFRKFWKKELS